MSDELPDIVEGIEYHSGTGTYRAAFDSQTTDPSIAVVEPVAQVEEKQPIELPPLYRNFDPETLTDFSLLPQLGTNQTTKKRSFPSVRIL